MQVEEGVWYRTRDGRKAEVKNSSGISDVLVDGRKISKVFTDCGTSNRVNPEGAWDIVAIWNDKNTDGTYKLPDHAVAACWRHESGELLSWSRSSNSWNGPFHLAVNPPEGRWLPLTEPTFPQRKRNPFRMCIVRLNGEEKNRVAVFRTSGTSHSFSVNVFADKCENDLTVVQWLTPEYEDELEAKQA